MTIERLPLTIVGMGLMGGSMAKSLIGQGYSIAGVDRDPIALERALQDSVIERAYSNLALGREETGMIVLAVPVGQILVILQQLEELFPSGAPVLDLGSTKKEITEAMDRLPPQFSLIGGHPMCGKEEAGYGASSATLYLNKRFVLCKTIKTDRHVEKLALDLVRAIGSVPVYMSPQEHDDLVAITSHVPYLVSSILSLVAGEKSKQHAGLWQLAASGYKDTSRLASTDPSMMLDILKTNRSAISEELTKYLDMLQVIADLIAREDFETLGSRLFKARAAHQRYKEESGQ